MNAHEAAAKDIIDRKMIFEFIEASLTVKHKKSIASALPTFYQDGVKPLRYLISTADVATTLATRDLKLSLQNLTLKAHGWDPRRMHNHVQETLATVGQTGETISENNQIVYNFEGHKQDNKNEKFLQCVSSLESKWHEGEITTRAQLEQKVVTQFQAMLRNKVWKLHD